MSIYIGRKYATETTSVLKHGKWDTSIVVRHYRSLDGETWEQVDVMFVATHPDRGQSQEMATRDSFAYLESVNWDLFREADDNKGAIM